MPRKRTGYFIVYHDMVDHPKCVSLSPFAWTLWIHGNSYCSRNLTDGHIPAGVLPRLAVLKDPAKAATELVEAGLWDPTPEGWVVHDYLDVQRSRDEVEADRSSAADRQAKHRANRQNGDVTGESQRDNGVTGSSADPPSTTSPTTTRSSPSSSDPIGPVDNFDDDDGVQRVLEALCDIKQQRTTIRSSPSGFRRTTIANDRAEHGKRIDKLIYDFPTASPETLAGQILGENPPTLRNHKRKDVA